MIKNIDPHHQGITYNWEGVMEFLYVASFHKFRTSIKIMLKRKTSGHYKETPLNSTLKTSKEN